MMQVAIQAGKLAASFHSLNDINTTSPYFSDLVPLYYYLLRSLQNDLVDKNFTSNEDFKGDLDKTFVGKDQKYYSCLFLFIFLRFSI